MTAPTFIQEAETAWDAHAASKTTPARDVLSGDVLVAGAIIQQYDATNSIAIANNGAALAWTQKQLLADAGGNVCWLSVWTTTVPFDRSGLTVTFTYTGNAWAYGANVVTIRDSIGVGASAGLAVATGTPSLGLTTVGDDSLVVVFNGDWNAIDGTGGLRTWLTGAGALSEVTYFRDAVLYATYAGYHANAGAAGLKTVGLSAPAGQKYTIAAVEVKGPATPQPVVAGMFDPQLVQKAWF